MGAAMFQWRLLLSIVQDSNKLSTSVTSLGNEALARVMLWRYDVEQVGTCMLLQSNEYFKGFDFHALNVH